MKMWKDLTREEKGKLLLAQLEGEVIEYYDSLRSIWYVTGEPCWGLYDIYRIQDSKDSLNDYLRDVIPKEGEGYLRLYLDGKPLICDCIFSDNYISTTIMFDGLVSNDKPIEVYNKKGTWLLDLPLERPLVLYEGVNITFFGFEVTSA